MLKHLLNTCITSFSINKNDKIILYQIVSKRDGLVIKGYFCYVFGKKNNEEQSAKKMYLNACEYN